MQRKIKLPSANSSPQAKLYWNENVDIDNYLQTGEYSLIMRQICRTPILCHPREATATKKWTFPRETWRQTQERMEERARRVRKVLAIMRNTTHTPKSDELDNTPRLWIYGKASYLTCQQMHFTMDPWEKLSSNNIYSFQGIANPEHNQHPNRSVLSMNPCSASQSRI